MNRLLSLAVAASLMSLAHASDGFLFRPLTDVVAGSQFGAQLEGHQYSVGTTVNQRGNLIGYQRNAVGQYRSFSVTEGVNPALVIIDTPDFVSLAAGEPVCFWIICTSALPWGWMFAEHGPVGQFVGRDPLLAPLPDALPDASFAGAFVDANRAGVVASSQQGEVGRFSAVLFSNATIRLEDIPWLVAVNDNVPPQVLGYDGSQADCLIRGERCAPPPVAGCDSSVDQHKNTRGKGHSSHGNGHGYGHYRCGPGKPGSDSYLGLTGNAVGGQTLFGVGEVVEDGGAVLLTVSAQGVISRLRFPTQLFSGEPLTSIFPLALNSRTAVLRADVHGSSLWSGRLLRCDFDPQNPDVNGDGHVDCLQGLRAIESPEQGLAVTAVTGFTLNNAGLLIGNAGYGAAGVGIPFHLDLNPVVPQADLLANRMIGAEDWELAAVMDLNDARRATGYGYPACGNAPQAVVLTPLTGVNTTLGFRIGDWLRHTQVEPGQSYQLAPLAKGGSGQYVFRYATFIPGSNHWELLQDWSSNPLVTTASTHEGDVCHRVEVRDALSGEQQQLVVRMRISHQPARYPLGLPSF